MNLYEISQTMKGIPRLATRIRTGNKTRAINPMIGSDGELLVVFRSGGEDVAFGTHTVIIPRFNWETLTADILVSAANAEDGIDQNILLQLLSRSYDYVEFNIESRVVTFRPTINWSCSPAADIMGDKKAYVYAGRIITHKSGFNSATLQPRKRFFKNLENPADGYKMIQEEFGSKGFTHAFTEIVHSNTRFPKVICWMTKEAHGPVDKIDTENGRQAEVVKIAKKPELFPGVPLSAVDMDTDMAAYFGKRQRELTQLILSSKCSGVMFDTGKMDFLFNAAKQIFSGKGIGAVSDNYHTYDELYHHRAILFATLCQQFPDRAWKSKQHDDPNFPMFDGMFICGIETPLGQATYHYDLDPYWDMFNVRELPAAPKFDGHTPADAIERIHSLADLYHRKSSPTIQLSNNFTKDCDKYLVDGYAAHAKEYNLRTEFYIDGCDMCQNGTFTVAFRFPGATRGHVVIDRNTGRIQTVKFYDTAYANTKVSCYKPDVARLILKWEGGLLPGLMKMCRQYIIGWEMETDDGCPGAI